MILDPFLLTEEEKNDVAKYLKFLEFNPVKARMEVFDTLFNGDSTQYDESTITESVMAETYIIDFLDDPVKAHDYYSFHGKALLLEGWTEDMYEDYWKILQEYIENDEYIEDNVKSGLRKLGRYVHDVIIDAMEDATSDEDNSI